MITRDPAEFLKAFGALPVPEPDSGVRATMRAALLVSPIGFDVNVETTSDNRYMSAASRVDPERAAAQHAAVVRRVVELGVPAIVFPGVPGLPDAVYPNNAFGTVPGALILGAMRHRSRRRETERRDVLEFFTQTSGCAVRDLSSGDFVAELTGSIIIDHRRAAGFCGLTGRADEAGCEAMHGAFDLSLTFCFDLDPAEYHTNIVLAILAGRACVIHPPSFRDPEAAAAIVRAYGDGAIVLADEEKERFVGNCLAITERDVLMSDTALGVLRDATRAGFERAGFRVHGVAVDELEKGGGSLRCLIAEVF